MEHSPLSDHSNNSKSTRTPPVGTQPGDSRTSAAATSVGSGTMWTLYVCPTTGGQFQLNISPSECIETLKKAVAKRLKLSKDRISLLYKERVLKDGTIRDSGLVEGGRVTLIPNVESGLVSQKPEHTVMQALENLTDSQVNEFLSGKAPLTLAMRLGDHMMFVQLQLSTSAPSSKRLSSKMSTASSSSTPSSSPQPGSPLLAPSVAKNRPIVQARSSSSSTARKTPVVVPTPVMATPVMATPVMATPVMATPVMATLRPPPITTSLPQTSSQFASTTPSPPESPSATSTSMPGPLPNNTSTSKTNNTVTTVSNVQRGPPQQGPVLDSVTLAEASRNLSQKLKELSQASGSPAKDKKPCKPPKEVVEPPSSPSQHTTTSKKSSCKNGAIIESMHHHGQGVYSGTFSGTLNPALQDRDGKPKRSISTIVHILNDLLGATPQYRAQMPHNRPDRKDRKIVTTHKISAPLSPCSRSPPSSPPPGAAPLSPGERMRLCQENRATRGKMEQIQMMLEERRQRKKARRQARSAPYSLYNSKLQQNRVAALHHHRREQAMEVDVEASNIADVTESSAYTELKQETVVA